jgi:hypothetical protein
MTNDISIATVERLLASRTPLPDPDCPALEDLALAIAAGTTGGELSSAFPHLNGCELCRMTAETLSSLTGEPTVPPDVAGILPARTGRWILPAAAAALFAGIGALLLWSNPEGPARHPEPSPSIRDDGALLPKGSADSLEVAVARGPARFVLPPSQSVETGDALGFFYTSATDGHLLIYNVEHNGTVTRLSPLSGPARIEAGVDVALPDGATVVDGDGDEWIVAAFFHAPPRVDDVERQLRLAAARMKNGQLQVQLDGARTVCVQQVRRNP